MAEEIVSCNIEDLRALVAEFQEDKLKIQSVFSLLAS